MGSLRAFKKARFGELTQRAIEGRTLDQPLLPSGQNFTFRDLTTEELVRQVALSRPLGLPEGSRGFTLVEEPPQAAMGKIVRPIEKGQASFPIEEADRPLLSFFEQRGIPLKQAEETVKKQYDAIVNEYVKYLKASGGKGVEQGVLFRDATGKVVGRSGRISNNPRWYREFYKEYGRAPRQSEYRTIAETHLREGLVDDFAGPIPPDEQFLKVEALYNKIRELRQKYPEDIIKPKEQPKRPELLPEGQGFTLVDEYPLRFRQRVPRNLKEQVIMSC